MLPLALLLIGFSLFSAVILALTHFSTEHYQDRVISRLMGLLLMCALSVLQMVHFAWLYWDYAWILAWPYRVALFVVAPAFFLFSQPLLRPSSLSSFRPNLLWHGIPILVAPWIPSYGSMPLAFTLGAGYLVWLGVMLHPLRHERVRFRDEIILLSAAFMIAVAISILGVFQTTLPDKVFFSLYAASIGVAFVLVQVALGLRPSLSADVSEVVQVAYTNSTLNHVDCTVALTRLTELIEQERIYTDAQMNLPVLAERMALSTHQLSELINTRLGKGFSRYLREARVAAAKIMLCEDVSASVLSVGLSVGFTSQSTFYDAFREIEGMTPGQFRKLHV